METNPQEELNRLARIRAQAPIIEAKVAPVNLRCLGSSVWVDVPGELDNNITIVGGVAMTSESARRMSPYREAVVLGVGPAVEEIKTGDRVIVQRSTLSQVVFEGNSYWLTDPTQIRGVIDPS